MALAGIISEHAVPVDPPTPDEDQTPQEKSIVQNVHDLLLRSKRGNDVYKCDWNNNYDFVFKGKQWSSYRPNYMFSEPVNILWAAMMQEVGIQTDSRPKTEYLSQEPSDELFAETMREINDVNWVKYSWNDVVTDAVTDCKWVHVSHAIVDWDPTLEGGLGDVTFEELDPTYCWWDPNNQHIDKLRHFIYAEPVPTSWLKQIYPEAADKIQADLQPVSGSLGSSEIVRTDQDSGSVTKQLRGDSASDHEKFGGEAMTLYIRCWLKDETIEQLEIEKDGEFGEPTKEYVAKKKYPKGRYICIANGALLEDRENGVRMPDGTVVAYEHGKFPIVPLVNYRVPRRYAGENEVTHTRSGQKIVNYVWNNILTQLKLAGNPRVKVTPASGIKDPKKITNAPTGVIVTNDINAVVFEPGIPIPSSHFNILEMAMTLVDRIYGLGETSRGAVPPNISSGVFFEGVLESEHTRVRLKNRNLDSFLQRVGQLMLSLYLQFYTVPRVFRITGKEGFPEFVTFFISEEEGKKMMNTQVTAKTKSEGFNVMDPNKKEIKGVPDIKISTGSALPFAKAIKIQNARELFQAGGIDRIELLTSTNWPNAKEVDRRMSEKEAKDAEAAQAAQGGPGGGG